MLLLAFACMLINSFPLLFDSTTKQDLYNEQGCVVPMIIIDKTTTEQVVCNGESPLIIKDNFTIEDGTFNSNQLNIEVGLGL